MKSKNQITIGKEYYYQPFIGYKPHKVTVVSFLGNSRTIVIVRPTIFAFSIHSNKDVLLPQQPDIETRIDHLSENEPIFIPFDKQETFFLK